MTEVKIVMDDYGLLYAILPDGSKRAIRADIFGNPFTEMTITLTITANGLVPVRDAQITRQRMVSDVF